MEADILATYKSPLDDITAVSKVAFPMKHGKIYRVAPQHWNWQYETPAVTVRVSRLSYFFPGETVQRSIPAYTYEPRRVTTHPRDAPNFPRLFAARQTSARWS